MDYDYGEKKKLKSQNVSLVILLVFLLGFFLFATSVDAQPATVGLRCTFNESYDVITPGFENIVSLSVTHLATGATVSTIDISVLLKNENALQGSYSSYVEVKLNGVIKNTYTLNQEISLNANENLEINVGTLTATTIESYAEPNTSANYDLEIKVTSASISGDALNSQAMIIPLYIDTTTDSDSDPIIDDDPVSPPPEEPEDPEPEEDILIYSQNFETGASDWSNWVNDPGLATVQLDTSDGNSGTTSASIEAVSGGRGSWNTYIDKSSLEAGQNYAFRCYSKSNVQFYMFVYMWSGGSTTGYQRTLYSNSASWNLGGWVEIATPVGTAWESFSAFQILILVDGPISCNFDDVEVYKIVT